MSLDPTERCGCCERNFPPVPLAIDNRPGLSAVRYRIGTFGSFRETMLLEAARYVQLRDWTARTHDDYVVALIEMWAYVLDILTFHQERYANEIWLPTARFRESIFQLAAMLDYRPAPGLAAGVWLAFLLDRGREMEIPAGLRVQSVPGPGEKPQKFEVSSLVRAHAELNSFRVFLTPKAFST